MLVVFPFPREIPYILTGRTWLGFFFKYSDTQRTRNTYHVYNQQRLDAANPK
jgi:hypothetical protein